MGATLITDAGSAALGSTTIIEVLTGGNPLAASNVYAASNEQPVITVLSAVLLQTPWKIDLTPGRPCNIDVRFANGANARVRLVRSFDQGATQAPMTDEKGNPKYDFGSDASCSFTETEAGVWYALQMYDLTAGSATTRISQ